MAFKRSAVRSRLSPPGRLAQLVAHPLDVREVTSSSLVSSTKRTTPYGVVLFIYSFLHSVVFPDPQGIRQLFKDCLASDLQKLSGKAKKLGLFFFRDKRHGTDHLFHALHLFM